MANTYSQIYVQIVFAVKGRQNLVSENHREELQKYITGIVQNREQKMLAIYCMPDHTHLFIDFKPVMSISNLVRDIKTGSCHFINQHRWIQGHFNWQEGFGAFSYSKNDIPYVCDYINNQKEHHSTQKFKDEYIQLLEERGVDHNDKYLFDWTDL
jgi:REP element-mobilizing transposase RayT